MAHQVARFHDKPEDLAIVIAFDPGGTTGYCILGVDPRVLQHSKLLGTLLDGLLHVEYGEIDCGTKHGQTGVGMSRGHDGLNMPGEIDGILRMVNMCDQYDNYAVVLEDFVLDVRKANMGRDLLTPVRIISGFTALLQYSFIDEPVMEKVFIQNRALAKTTCTDDRLKNWKLYDRNSGPHARDALRHAFYFLRERFGGGADASYKRHLAWPHLFNDPQDRSKTTAKPKSQVGQRVTSLG